MAKEKQQKKHKISKQAKDVMAIIFLFSLIIGMLFTTHLSNQATGQNIQLIQAAGLPK